MTRAFWEVNKYDVELRMKDQGMPDPRPNLIPHEVVQEGPVHEDANVKVTTARVHHPPTDAWAYRFDAKDRSIVISGDTAYSENLIRLAKGADVLVHEVMNIGLMERNLASNPNREKLLARIRAVHTTGEEVGRVAQAAGVKKVVLSHLLNSRPDDGISDEQWAEGVRKNYSGEVVVGRDLMEV
jgi:ribonuclease BN (tRNA processing enzyme)